MSNRVNLAICLIPEHLQQANARANARRTLITTLLLIVVGSNFVWFMQSDANVVVYRNLDTLTFPDTVVWATDTQDPTCVPKCVNMIFLLRIDDNCNLIRDRHNCDSTGSLQDSLTLFDGNSLTGHNWVTDR